MPFKDTLNQAYQAMAIRDYVTAEELVLEMINNNPEKSGLYLLLGNIYLKTEQTKKAIDQLKKSIALKENNPEAYNNLAVIYRKSGDLAASLTAIKKAYSLSNKSPDICYNIANLYKQIGDSENALTFYKKALKIKPDFSLIYNNIGTYYNELEDYESAIKWYREGLEYDPNNPTLHYNIGVILEAENNYQQALIEYKRALKSRPGWINALNNLGITLQKLGSNQEALNTFKDILKVDPENIQGHNNIAVILTNLGKLEEAEQHLDKALKIDPEYFNASLNLTRIQEDKGELKESIQNLRTLLQRDENNTDVLQRLGKLLMETGAFNEASNHIRKLLRLNPNSSTGYLILGQLNLRSGRKKRALSCFTSSINLNSKQFESLYQRALLLREMGKYSKSILDIEKILDHNPKSFEARFLLSEIYIKQKENEKAMALLQELLKETSNESNTIDILTALIKLYRNMGDKDAAIKTVETLLAMQGDGEGSETLDQMGSTFKIYDKILNDYTKEYEKIWDRNLEAFIAVTTQTMEEDGGKEEESVFVESIPEFDNEIVPIIDIGGIEPIIEVNEDEETIILSELEEDLNLPDEIEMEMERELTQLREKARKERDSVNRDQNNSLGQASPQYIPVPVPQVQFYPQQVQPPFMQTPPAYQPPPPPPEDHIDYPEIIPEQAQEEKISNQDIEKDPTEKEEHIDEKESNPSNLLGYLESLTQFLPEEKRISFYNSDMHLKLETLRAKISGKENFRSKIEKKHLPVPKKMETKITSTKVEKTFDYIEKLSTFLPDKAISSAMKGRIKDILENMRKNNE